MATNTPKTKPITLKGTAFWAHLSKPEKYQGTEIGYSIEVKLESEEANKKLENYLENFWEEQKTERFSDKKISAKASPHLPLKEDNEGNTVFKAKTKHYFEDKVTGERINRTIPVFDSTGKPLPAGTLVGNGSKVQINVTPAAYCLSSTNFGVKLLLNAVLVSELVEYNSSKSASAYGFEVTEDNEVNDEAEF